MATLGKIRKHGWLLLIVIGVALLAFIVGDGIKALQPSKNIRNVGEINGESVSAQEYQKLVDEYSNVVKFARGSNSLTEAELAQIKDEVWNQLVSKKLIEGEVEKLGLTVTPAELEATLDEGTDPMLAQSMFVNQQTGKFDKDLLYNFLAEYNELGSTEMPAQYAEYYQNVYQYWKFIEKNLQQQLLVNKYEALVSKAQLSNPVAAQQLFDGRNGYCKLIYAVVPFSSINDTTVNVTAADLKAVYESHKENYRQPSETRDVKYIDIAVVPSEADRAALKAEVEEVAGQLAETADEELANVVRMAESTVTFSEVPRTAAGLPADIAEKIATAEIGVVEPVYYNEEDDTYNTFKLIAKTTTPDSIQYRQIQVVDEDAAKMKTLADSIYNALLNKGDFAEIAERYGQSSEGTWVGTSSYEAGAITGENAIYINTLNSMKKGEIKKLSFEGAEIIVEMLDTKNPVEKYQVAAVKRVNYFGKETYNKAYNELSQFVASNQTLDEFKANAEESGFQLLELNNLLNSAHTVGGVNSTREALRWAFDAKAGEVSQIFEAGENDHLMVLALEKIHKAGYSSPEDVKDVLKYEALNNKKAEKIMAELKDAKTLSDVMAVAGAKSDTLSRVTFNAPAFVSLVPASEPIISGKASTMEAGEVAGPIKGNSGIYFIQVLERNNGAQTYNAEQEQKNAAATAARNTTANRLINELFAKGKVVDNRYLFF